ncbi:recombination protein [Lactococcus phage CW09]|uniref:Recombination protein n=2 Tax=Ceduovirus cv20R03M TaxID=2845156 RepID=A0A482N8Q0_9CAUD|nr:Erf-like ssDNA annealing protein [Lactococcus phage 20R03M]QBQ81993.1 recombination protein [Lactococcus phage 20R03M]QBQ82026.1 recombination protein [Lactococcus phage CW09]
MESKILKLINEIKVPKSQYNSFGKYNFRNNEDIQTALKPLLLQYGLMEKAYTEMKEMNGELMLHVHIDIYDPDNLNDVTTGDGWAVIDINKKGMDKAQATGASQSYASKYAYGQALKLDDTKDADSTNKGKNNVTQLKSQPKANYQYKLSDLKKMVANKEMSSDRANELCKQGKVNMNA